MWYSDHRRAGGGEATARARFRPSGGRRDGQEAFLKILYVEDDDLVRGVLANELAERGYEVLEAATVDRAERILTAHAVDLLITDIRLPGEKNGWDLAVEARARRPDLPIILVTGYSDAEPRELPRSRLLLKPFRPSRLLAIVTEMTASPPHR